MKRREAQELTERQLDVLRVLWSEGEADVNGVREQLARQGDDLARTTVATLLTRLEDRGAVGHREEGRRHVYHARISETVVRENRLEAVTELLFDGSVPDLVRQLLDARDVDSDDLARVRRLIEEYEDTHRREPGEDGS